jgi:hypothetical protein
MLIVSGIIFLIAMLFVFIDRWFDNAELDLSKAYTMLLFTSAILIGIKTYISL